MVGINLSGLSNVANDLKLLEQYLPAIIAIASGSASETVNIPIPAESYTVQAGSFGNIEISNEAFTIPLTFKKA